MVPLRHETTEVVITLVKKEGGGEPETYAERVAWHVVEGCVIQYYLSDPRRVAWRFYDQGERGKREPAWRLQEVPIEGFHCLVRGDYYDQDVWRVVDVSDNLKQIQVCFSETWAAFKVGNQWDFFLSSDRGLHEFHPPEEVVIDESGNLFVRTVGRTIEYFPFGKDPWPWPLFNSKDPAFRALVKILTPDEENPLTMLVRAKDQPYRGEGRKLARSLHALMLSMLTHEVGALKLGKSKDGCEQDAEERDARKEQRFIDDVSTASS